MSAQAILLVFLKYPEPGKVKTRLAATIGAHQAAALYRQWITQVFETLQPLRDRFQIIGYFDGAEASDFGEWRPLVDAMHPQPTGSLGERLEAGFEQMHTLGGPVLAIGTDCLELDSDLLIRARNHLVDHDAVFGPADDGGYYLVGTARYLPTFFSDIRWSSPHTLADHLQRCHERGWRVVLLPARSDLDTWEDWQAYRQRQGYSDDDTCP